MITVIITSAGNSTRSGLKTNKVLWKMPNGLTVLENATATFERFPEITQIIYTASVKDVREIKEISYKNKIPTMVVLGGKTRFDSVYNALKFTKTNWVLIHDGARPFVDYETVYSCIDVLKRKGTAIACTTCIDTVAETNSFGEIVSAGRKNKYIVQTPQGFKTEEILKAYSMVENPNEFTDDSGIYARYIGRVCMASGNSKNIKLTNPEDFERFKTTKVGVGYDLHVLTENRKLILGGIQIPHDKGLLGHSDADVLVHAIMDALLSSLSLRDIGYHFSDKDERYKDISSMLLLKQVLEMVNEKGYKPNNVSAVIMAEKPKLSPFIPQIVKNLAKALDLPENSVGITCTTSEKVGLVGREEAIAVHANCTVISL